MMQFRNPKILIPVVLGIVGGWLIASSGEAILDSWLPVSDYIKVGIGCVLVLFGVIKAR
jgi:hypothetical protein